MPVILSTKTPPSETVSGLTYNFIMLIIPKIVLAAYVAIGARIQKHNTKDEAITALIGIIITGGMNALLVLALQDRQNNHPSRDLLLKITSIASVVTAPLIGDLCYPTKSSPSQIIVDGLIGAGIIAYFQLTGLGMNVGWELNQGYYLEAVRDELEPRKRTTWGLNVSDCCSFQTYFNQRLFSAPAPVAVAIAAAPVAIAVAVAEPTSLEHTAVNNI